MILTVAEATVMAASITGGTYGALMWGQRRTYKKTDAGNTKLDELLMKHGDLQQTLLDHTRQDETSFAELRRAIKQRRRGFGGLRLALALLALLLK